MVTQASSKAQKPSQTTSEKILKAARALFVEKGFSGTSMGQIATKDCGRGEVCLCASSLPGPAPRAFHQGIDHKGHCVL
ncbi:MAG: hypothetical protein K0R52_898 [Alphaproteobacteria bacterium]|nr:hypothetical protein [Alphaproteobacteria bacterium]